MGRDAVEMEGFGPSLTPSSSSHDDRSNDHNAEQNERSKSLSYGFSHNLKSWDALYYYWVKLCGTFEKQNSQRVVKEIDASPEVLQTYHDSFLFGKVPISVKARTTLRSGLIGTTWNVLEFFLALLSGVLYVYYTYNPDIGHNWIFRIQNAISIAFLADYVLRIYSSPVRLYFIFSVWGIVDLLTTLPIILVFKYNIRGANIIRLLQFVRIVRISALINQVGLFGSSVMQQIILLCIATFGVIILDAGLLQWVEYHLVSESTRASCSTQGCITFWESFYFLIVTISTVGYGDVTPNTIVGQLIAILTIIAALTILPIQIGRITSLAFRRPFGGSFSSQKITLSRFLIISGSVTFSAVQNCLAEFYNPTHSEDLEAYPLRVIILAPFTPSFELNQILSLYNGLVEFIEGSPVRQSDLERVSADRATAFFLLADKDVDNYQVEDAAQVVRALAVHRFCRANHSEQTVRIILEVLDPETHKSSIWGEAHMFGIEVICPVKVHYKMMARSCAVHGLYTLITNLFTSELKMKYFSRKHFMSEYFHSFDNEIYPVVFPRAFHNLSFEDVAELIFVKYSSTLFAVDTVIGYGSHGQVDRKVLLYPRSRRIRSDDVGLIISTDLHTAYAISMYRPDTDTKDQKLGFVDHLWDHATTTSTIKGRDNRGTELLDPVSGKWKRSMSSVSRASHRASQNTAFGEDVDTGPFTSNSGQGNLVRELKSAIQNSNSRQEPLDNVDRNQTDSKEIGILQNRDVEATGSDSPTDLKSKKTAIGGGNTSNSGRRFPGGKSLQIATENLLAWPPASLTEMPHPAVFDENEEVIMADLKSRTIAMVAFNVPHVLVCCQSGWPTNLFYFVSELRKPGFPNPPVVILHPKNVNVQQWGTVAAYRDVFYLKGSPAYELDLLRGGVLQAGKVVILSDRGLPIDLGVGGDMSKYMKRTPAAYTSDVNNIVIAANVEILYGDELIDNVIVEMQDPEAFYYLRPQYEISKAHFPRTGLRRNRDAMVHFVPPFMAGKAVTSALLGFLMRSTFYNRNTQSIVDQLIEGGHVYTEDGLQDDKLIILEQVSLPSQYRNRPYSDLFLGFLREKDLLPIGLYRARGVPGAPTAYVLTNPPPDYVVNPDDLVYVLR